LFGANGIVDTKIGRVSIVGYLFHRGWARCLSDAK